MIRKVLLIFVLLLFLVIFSETAFKAANTIDTSTRDYYLNHTYQDTGSKNIVTGIYLDYRLFDSIFEAGILIVTVTGIIFMSKKDDEVR